MSIKGIKKSNTATTKVTVDGIFVPNIPGATEEGAYVGGRGGGWFVSILI
jgi:hypothetical protein